MTERQRERARKGAAVGLVGAGAALPAGVAGHVLGKRRVAEIVSERMKYPSSFHNLWREARDINQGRRYREEYLKPRRAAGLPIEQPFEIWRGPHSPRVFYRTKLPTRAPLRRIPRRYAAVAAILAGAAGAGLTYGMIHRGHKKA